MNDKSEIRAKVWAIVKRYARPKYPDGAFVPMRCTPSAREIAKGNPTSVNKIIYDGWDNAQRAAQEMFQITGVRMEVYTCHRSRRKHHRHLTTDDDWMTAHGKGKERVRDDEV